MTTLSLVDLRKEIARALARSREAFPSIPLEEDEFLRYLCERIGPDGELPPHLEDLYLACGCAKGLEAALTAFDRHYQAQIVGVLRRMRLDDQKIDEIHQDLRHRLFVAEGRAPRIADYRGIGELGSWVRATVSRLALARFRREKRDIDLEDFDWLDPGGDPAVTHLKRLYSEEFKAAFETALSKLSPRERTLLRQQILDGVSVEELAKLYKVHRVTVSRWLGAIRQTLLDSTKVVLSSKLAVAPAELDSIIRLISSQLDASVERLLRASSQG